MRDLTREVLEEFAECSQPRCYKRNGRYIHQSGPWKLDYSFHKARLSGRSTAPKEIVDQDGIVHASIREAARQNGLSDMTVRNLLKSNPVARTGNRYTQGKFSFRYLP